VRCEGRLEKRGRGDMNAPRERVVVECVLYDRSRRSRLLRCARISRAQSWRKSCQPTATTTTLSNYLYSDQFQSNKMNVSGTLSFFRLFRDPSLCLPHHTMSTFNHLPIPLSRAFTKTDSGKKVDIRAVVLDKDNCFAVPKENEVYKPYTVCSTSFNVI
jgi:hypothetical protein